MESGTDSSRKRELATTLHRLRSTLARLKAELELAEVDSTLPPVDRLLADLDEAFAIADRVRRNFATAATRFGGNELKPTVSIGVTARQAGRTRQAALLGQADRNLYAAKHGGRNRVVADLA